MNKEIKTIKYVDFKGKSHRAPIKRWCINLMMPVKEYKNTSYVLLDDVKTMCQNNNLDYENLLRWLTGQTCPIIEAEGEKSFDCIYPWDVECWVYHQIRYKKEPYFVD